MKTYFVADEWYPVYSVEEKDVYASHVLDVPPETKQRWKIAEQCFRDCQDEIRSLIAENKRKKP